MTISGSISQIKARTTASSDVIQVITLEAHTEEFGKLRDLMQKPLKITLEESLSG